MAQQQADALALLAETALHHELDPGAPGERYQVVVHVDAAVLADPDQPGQSVLEDGARVSAETSRRLACDASRVVMRHDEDGRTVEVGARTRTIPPALRRALHHRDRAAASRAAGCRSARDITSVTGPRRPDHALEPRPALPPAPPRGPRRGLPGRSRGRRRAAVPAAGWPAPPRGPAAGRGAPRSGPGTPGAARRAGAPPPRADGLPVLAGGAPGCGLGDRRPASAGRARRGVAKARVRTAVDGMIGRTQQPDR